MGTKFVGFLVAFLCVFAANYSEGNSRKLAESFPENGPFWDGHKTEQVWNYCRKHLQEDSMDIVMDLDLSQSVKTILQKAISDLPPNKKETILDCLRNKKFPLEVLKQEHEQETSFHKYQTILSHWASIPRRYLRGNGKGKFIGVRNSITLSPDSSTPNIAPTPMEQQSPVVSPTPVLSERAPESSPRSDNFDFLSPLNLPLPKNVSPSPVPLRSFGISREYVVAAAISSGVAFVVFMCILLFCCLKKRRNRVEPKDGQRDEKPLLNFCTSDISAGSSQKSNAIHNPSSKDFNSTSAIGASLATNIDSSQSAQTHAVGKTGPTLPLPPGVTARPAPQPPPPPKPPAPAPPPPLKAVRPPNPPKLSPLGPHHRGKSSTGEASEISGESEAPKTKLKPFFWDKVLANPDHSMVWHEIKAGSFQFDEEMMKTLFGYVPTDKNKNENGKDSSSFESIPQFVQIIDPKKSQNLAILLKALNVTTEEVCDALREGNELPAEFTETLLRMAPTTDEELKLRLYSGDVSHLGPAERFLKAMVDIPFAFKRLECLLFVSTFQEEVLLIKESFSTLEVACKELRNSKLFLKLLEAVLKTGNRMNDGTYRGGAQAFKLDTLLKLSDVKGTDGKTTLLHFVVHEIIRSEGVRAARILKESRSMSSVNTDDLIEDSSHETGEYHRSLGLQVVSGLSNELENVRKAALIDNQSLSESVFKLGLSLSKTREFLESDMKSVNEESEFYDALSSFVDKSESDVELLTEEEKRIMGLVKSTGDYFHGKSGRDEALHLFVIVRDFLLMLDKACRDVKSSTKLASKTPKKEAMATSSSSPSQESISSLSQDSPSSPSREGSHESMMEIHLRLFPAMREREMDDDFSSDDES